MGAYTEIVDFTFTANETSRTFSGLSINKDDFIKVVGTFTNTTGNSCVYAIYPNNQTTDSNYTRQLVVGSGTSVVAVRGNLNLFAFGVAGTTSSSFGYIKLSENDKFNMFANHNDRIDGSLVKGFTYTTTPSLTFTSGITSLTLFAGVTNAIGIGSRIQIYKLAAEKVADFTVASNSTQVDIPFPTGTFSPAIDKDSEYLLVSDLVAGVNFARYRLTPNDLTTESGYHSQLIGGNGSTTFAGRGNSPEFGDGGVSAGIVSLIHTHIKLSNIGAYTAQSYELRNVGSTAPLLINHFTSSTAENITSITKLNVFSNMTNGIGAGTRFHLYKLYE